MVPSSGHSMGDSLVPSLALWAWLATLPIALWFIQSLRSYLRLRQFPGPPVAAWSKLWMMRSTLHGRMHLDVAEACKQYGTSIHSTVEYININVFTQLGHLTRIGPNDLVTDDPHIIRKISAVRSPYTRSDWYNATAFSHSLNHVFCERNEERHVELRNKLVPGV